MMKRVISLLLAISCMSMVLVPSAFAGARPALTKGDAENKAPVKAANKWGGQVWWRTGKECAGPFENVAGHTQYACYGGFETGGHAGQYWQINLDPFGTITFERI